MFNRNVEKNSRNPVYSICVNACVMLRSTYDDGISPVSCVEPLVGFHPTDRTDLHNTSPGDDGRTGRKLAAPKHTCPLYSQTSRYTARSKGPTQPSDVVFPSPSSPPFPPFPPSLSFALSDSPGTVKSSELSLGMSDDCVELSTHNPLTPPHTHAPTHRRETHFHRCSSFISKK